MQKENTGIKQKISPVVLLRTIYHSLAHFSNVSSGGFGAGFDVVGVGNHFGTDEPFFEVGVDFARRLGRFGADGDRPGTCFFGAGSEVGV